MHDTGRCKHCKEQIFLWEEYSMWLHAPDGYRYCRFKPLQYRRAEPEQEPEDLPLALNEDDG